MEVPFRITCNGTMETRSDVMSLTSCFCLGHFSSRVVFEVMQLTCQSLLASSFCAAHTSCKQ